MFDNMSQELKEVLAEAAENAAVVVSQVITDIENVLDNVEDQLNEWAETLRTEPDTGGTEGATPNTMFDYLVKHSTGAENAGLNASRKFLLSDFGRDALEAMYEAKRASRSSAFDGEARWHQQEWPGDDWWAGKTDKY